MQKAAPTARGRRFAAVLDLENLLIVRGQGLAAPEIQALMTSIIPRVVGMPVRVATGESVLRLGMAAINPKWGLTMVKMEPDAADHALIDAAHEFISAGVTDLVVASGDHVFVPLSAHARLHVISHPDHLSKTLRLAATTVTLLRSAAAPLASGVAS